MSNKIASDLHFHHFRRIFAIARGAHKCPLFWFLLSVSDYGPFAKSFGLSGKIDGADGANEADIVRESMDRGIFVCQAFSKVLIVRAIGRASPDPSEGGEGLEEYRLLKFPKLGI